MNIAFVKTGWSEFYNGGPVFGDYKHVQKFKEAHERFNFKIAMDGRFYAYVPPIGKSQSPPKPSKQKDWLVIFVAKRPNKTGLIPVGWYQKATFHNDYIVRPEYKSKDPFETDVHGEKYCYCISADEGWLIPPSLRDISFPGTHFKRTPIVYASGGKSKDGWRKNLCILANKLLKREYSKDESGDSDPSTGFPSPEHRKRVEKAAIEKAKQYLRKLGHIVVDRQKDNCGYDLLSKHKKTDEEFHVEVKGTSNKEPRFFMSKNEYLYMPNPKWRLAMVSDALGKGKLSLLTIREVKKQFEFQSLSYEATFKGKKGS